MSDTQDKVIVNKGNEDNKDNAKETKTKVGKSKRKAAKETRDKLYAQDETNKKILYFSPIADGSVANE